MKKIWTNGCYDVLHIGHIRLFQYAKSLGDELIVGIDSDVRVKLLKGNSRPINNQNDRKEMLESIKYIDKVYIFNDPEEMNSILLKENIDTIIVGSEYKDKKVNGSDIVKNINYFSRIGDYSTSSIIGDKK